MFYFTFLTKEPCLNICLNITLYRPDVNERYVQAYIKKTVNHFTLLQIKCEPEHSANRPCDRNTHKEENKLPPNSKIQETDLLVTLRFGT